MIVDRESENWKSRDEPKPSGERQRQIWDWGATIPTGMSWTGEVSL